MLMIFLPFIKSKVFIIVIINRDGKVLPKPLLLGTDIFCIAKNPFYSHYRILIEKLGYFIIIKSSLSKIKRL